MMSLKNLLAVGCVVMIAFVAVAADETFVSSNPATPGPGLPALPEAIESLFQGDMVPEMGLGCTNPTFNSGGPNDFAVGVTATLLPPFGITSTTYNVFSGGTFVTAYTFKVWAGGAGPGTELAAQTGLPPFVGNNTVAIAPPIVMTAPAFYFGFYQPQTTAGMRLGLDTSSGSAGTSYLRAPTCGAASFVTVDSLGFAGNWVMRVIIDDTIPVELMTFSID